MGRTAAFGGAIASTRDIHIKAGLGEKLVALAGNPNVGKSTVFNTLTGMNQHTGNWTGKTVAIAQGRHELEGVAYRLVDLPGTYSLLASSMEEEAARDFICFGGADAAVVVVDATCLERNLNLVLQTMEITRNVVLCVNLMDEAGSRKIALNLSALSERLGIPVVPASARKGWGLKELMEQVGEVCSGKLNPCPLRIRYTKAVEEAVTLLEPVLELHLQGRLPARWAALRLIEGEAELCCGLLNYMGLASDEEARIQTLAGQARAHVCASGVEPEKLRDVLVRCIVLTAESIAEEVVQTPCRCRERDRKLDALITGRRTGLPIMALMLCGILWLSIEGANFPSELIAAGMNHVESWLDAIFAAMRAPAWLHGLVVAGMFRTLAWVVSVMLPPMAIFFPLFTLLEDAGYLPRVAFNLDSSFKKAHACGKQALTMCMVCMNLQ